MWGNIYFLFYILFSNKGKSVIMVQGKNGIVAGWARVLVFELFEDRFFSMGKRAYMTSWCCHGSRLLARRPAQAPSTWMSRSCFTSGSGDGDDSLAVPGCSNRNLSRAWCWERQVIRTTIAYLVLHHLAARLHARLIQEHGHPTHCHLVIVAPRWSFRSAWSSPPPENGRVLALLSLTAA